MVSSLKKISLHFTDNWDIRTLLNETVLAGSVLVSGNFLWLTEGYSNASSYFPMHSFNQSCQNHVNGSLWARFCLPNISKKKKKKRESMLENVSSFGQDWWNSTWYTRPLVPYFFSTQCHPHFQDGPNVAGTISFPHSPTLILFSKDQHLQIRVYKIL